MSKFTLSVVFDGICAYVPIVPKPNDGIDAATGMMVALIDANPVISSTERRKALDDSDLRLHLPFIRCPLSDIADLPDGGASPGGDDPTGIWYLNRQRVTLKLKPDVDRRVSFLTAGDNSIFTVPRVSEFVPDRVQGGSGGDHRVRRNVIGDRPPSSSPAAPGVIAQFKIDGVTDQNAKEVTIGSHQQQQQAEWQFQQTLSNQPYKKNFAARVALTIPDLESAVLVISSLDNPTEAPIELPLRSDGKAEIKVLIVNACGDDPLEWDDPSKPQEGDTDEDIKWLYFFCQGRTAIQALLDNTGRQLPVPVATGKPGSTGSGGRKCFGGLFEPENI